MGSIRGITARRHSSLGKMAYWNAIFGVFRKFPGGVVRPCTEVGKQGNGLGQNLVEALAGHKLIEDAK